MTNFTVNARGEEQYLIREAFPGLTSWTWLYIDIWTEVQPKICWYLIQYRGEYVSIISAITVELRVNTDFLRFHPKLKTHLIPENSCFFSSLSLSFHLYQRINLIVAFSFLLVWSWNCTVSLILTPTSSFIGTISKLQQNII
jgi:hypothetical protein